MQSTELNQSTELLNEILMAPSNTLKADRFMAESQAAPCNGECATGVCKAYV